VRRTAEEADQRAVEGRAQSERLAEAMREAQGRAKRIHGVIEVIDLVAFQTHILSINAAVEAAHAGERGKGFAVVAAEVRTLADRAAQAAKEARAMVGEAEQALAAGGQRARETGERLQALGALVGRAGVEMGEVAARVDAQDAALGAMEATLADVAAISRGNVEDAEDVARLAAEARERADLLSDCVRLFELPSDPLAHPRHARVRALAAEGAAAVGAALEDALRARRIDREALFSTAYVPIPDTDPTKFTTPFDALCDALLPPLQEPLAAAEPWIVFAISANRDGYVPTHNLRFSQPLTGDRARDLVGHRGKRIFGDRVGRTVGRHEAPWMLQVYRRDTGEIMFDMSVPIRVAGTHWGGFRIGYALG
jgi:methyl-accepting chemotaxis protein/methyl-accepting chemotaxis protein-2 (aspartate sensor receptor)